MFYYKSEYEKIAYTIYCNNSHRCFVKQQETEMIRT